MKTLKIEDVDCTYKSEDEKQKEFGKTGREFRYRVELVMMQGVAC